jgi:restriction system protein
MSEYSDRADRADRSDSSRPRLRPSGGYRNLRSFQVATIIYDGTVLFCERFIDKRSRTHDQMVQAARSGQKDIAEGSRAAATSSQSELHLVNVARASIEELLLDYEDYLRQRGHRLWEKADAKALAVRTVGRQPEQAGPAEQTNRSDPAAHWKLYTRWLEHKDPTVAANALVCLIHQANYLLDQQTSALEREFVRGGGYRERLAAARIAERAKADGTARTDQPVPDGPHGPRCGKPMALRTARKGAQPGSQFWGCSAYPNCNGTRPVN